MYTRKLRKSRLFHLWQFLDYTLKKKKKSHTAIWEKMQLLLLDKMCKSFWNTEDFYDCENRLTPAYPQHPTPFSFECCWKQSDSQKQNLHSRLGARENSNRQATHSWKPWDTARLITWPAQLTIKKVCARAYRGFAFLKIMNLLWVTFHEATSRCDREAFVLCMYILQSLKSYWAHQSALCFLLSNHLATCAVYRRMESG